MRRVGVNLVILSVIVVLTLNFGTLPPFGVDLVLAQDGESGYGEIQSIAWNPNGSIIAVGQGYEFCNFERYEDYSIRLLDATTGDLIDELDFNICTVRFLDWNSDGTKLISTGGADADGFGVVWDIASGKRIAVSQPVSMPGRLMDRWSPDDTRILSVSEAYRAVDIWDPASGDTIMSIQGSAESAEWSPNGQEIFIAGMDLAIWDAATGQELTKMISPDGLASATTVVWATDNSRIFTGRPDGLIQIWDGETKIHLSTLEAHPAWIHDLALSPDNTRLASAGEDGTVRVWDVQTGDLIETLTYSGSRVYAVDWSPDGTKLAYGGLAMSGKAPEVQIVDAPITEAMREAMLEDEAERNRVSCLSDQALPTQLTINEVVEVVEDGADLRLRVSPDLTSTVLQTMAGGTVVTIVGGPACSGGYRWWQVRLSDGTVGWAVEADPNDYFLQPSSS